MWMIFTMSASSHPRRKRRLLNVAAKHDEKTLPFVSAPLHIFDKTGEHPGLPRQIGHGAGRLGKEERGEKGGINMTWAVGGKGSKAAGIDRGKKKARGRGKA